ncbi:MAG: MFS transporter [Chloroflexota bacterium]
MPRPRVKIFYGWWVVAASAAVLLVDAGLGFYAFGVFFTPLIEEFGWTRAEFSGTVSLAFVVTGIASPIVGNLTDRFGARKVMLCSAVIMGGSFALLGLTQSLWYFYLVFVVEAASRAGAHVVPITTLVANWFEKRRGLAMGIVVTGISLGGVLITPLSTYLIDLIGWRLSYLMLGILIWVSVIPLVILVIRNLPQHKGLLPYGRSHPGELDSQTVGTSKSSQSDDAVWTVRTAIRTSAFWFSAATVALLFLGGSAVMTHTIPLLRDRGVSAEGAAMVMSCVAGAGILGKTLSGYLADRLQIRFVVMMIGILIAAGIFILINFSSGALVWLFAVVFGFAMGGVIAIQSLLVAYCFGLASLGSILGGVALIADFGFAIGPLLAGYVFDVTGSYDLAFQLYIASCLLAALLVLFVQPPRLRRQAVSADRG